MNKYQAELNKAFSELRKMGYIARQNFECCGSCAGYAIAEKASEMVSAGRKAPRGAVYYHRQSGGCRDAGENFYIYFGQIDTSEHGEIGIETEEVGKEVMEVFERNGIKARWNGDPNEAILVVQE